MITVDEAFDLAQPLGGGGFKFSDGQGGMTHKFALAVIEWHEARRSSRMWQPIETAPRDGTRVLCFGEGPYGDLECYTAVFSAHSRSWHADPNEATEYLPEKCTPTHWMPLPAPPTSTP
jgi:hypothetical protein